MQATVVPHGAVPFQMKNKIYWTSWKLESEEPNPKDLDSRPPM